MASVTEAAKPEVGRSTSCSRRIRSRSLSVWDVRSGLFMADLLSKLGKALAEQIPATREPCLHRTFGQAHGGGGGGEVHLMEVIEDQRLAILVGQGVHSAADGLVACRAIEFGVVAKGA